MAEQFGQVHDGVGEDLRALSEPREVDCGQDQRDDACAFTAEDRLRPLPQVHAVLGGEQQGQKVNRQNEDIRCKSCGEQLLEITVSCLEGALCVAPGRDAVSAEDQEGVQESVLSFALTDGKGTERRLAGDLFVDRHVFLAHCLSSLFLSRTTSTRRLQGRIL